MDDYDFYRAVEEGKIEGVSKNGDRFEIDLNVVLKEHLELKARVAELESALDKIYTGAADAVTDYDINLDRMMAVDMCRTIADAAYRVLKGGNQ